MSESFDELYDIDGLDDGELQELVANEIEQLPQVDNDLIEIEVSRGHVLLSGRVGTETELQQIEDLLGNVLGLPSYANELVVDPLVRTEQPEAADKATLLYPEDPPSKRTDPEAQHLMGDTEDRDATQDLKQAAGGGRAWEPPEGPGREGIWSREDH